MGERGYERKDDSKKERDGERESEREMAGTLNVSVSERKERDKGR